MGKFRLRMLLALAAFACVLTLSGCSSNSTLTVTLTPSGTSTVTINQGQTQAITAAVSNDPNNAGVTWSLSGGGTLLSPTTTSVIYEAPAVLPGDTTVSVTATSVTNTSITAGLSISVDSVLTITTPSLPVGALGVPYSAVINAGGFTGSFIWELENGTLPPGLSLSSSTTDTVIIVGTPTKLGTFNFTVQVTDSSGTVASQALSITINVPPPLSVATRSLSSGMVGVSYNQTLQAASGTPPYTWTITGTGCSGSACLPAGLSLTGAVISGVPTTAGTSSFTVNVTDSTVPTPQKASAGLSITINPSTANDANLAGNYAFLVSGFDLNGRFAGAGSFVADGAGNISNGVMDTNDPAGLQLNQAFTGSYAIGSNNLGTMALGARSFALSVMANGNAKIIEFDSTGTRSSGVVLKQTTSDFSQPQIHGNYAFGFSGSDAVAARSAVAGAMIADGAGHFTNGVLDANDAGVTQNVAFTGTYAGIDSNTGRGTATISIAGQGTTSYSFYIVSNTQLLMMEIDFVSGQVSPIVSGSMLQQPVSLGASSLSGIGVLQTSAISGGTAQSQVGFITGDGVVNFNVNTDENTNGTPSTPSCTGTYIVDSTTGRVALTYSGTACAESVLYLVGTNQAFVMGTDANVTSGFMEAQSGTPFSNASLSGTYAGGTVAPVLAGAGTQVDIALGDGIGTIDFTTDSNTTGGLVQNQASSGSYTLVSSGRGTLVPISGGQPEIFYMVSPTEFISLFSTDPNATLEGFQQ
ncbi:MAG TPA: putative Ig domain-containing protein [Terriglobales bacterium]|nr:putative Ig domain-containing protein [Terriglobales bacterium]